MSECPDSGKPLKQCEGSYSVDKQYDGQQFDQQYGQWYHQQYGGKLNQNYGQQYGQQYGGPYVSTDTAVVTTKPGTLVVVQQTHLVVRNYMVLSVLSCIFGILPIGLVAVLFSYLCSQDAHRGNYHSAKTKGRVALGLSIASIILAVLIIIMAVIFNLVVYFYVSD